VTKVYAVLPLQEAVDDRQRLEGFATERALTSDTPDLTLPQRARDAVRDGVRPLS
jgi:hypothetical protein